MNEDVRNIVLGVLATGVSASLGWLARTYLWRRRLRRKQAFFGLPAGSECLLVVNREAGGDNVVHRFDVFAMLELSALIKDCGAQARILAHDVAHQGFGDRTEFCVGGPYSNRRTAAHLATLLPGVTMNVDVQPSEVRGSITVGGERHLMEKGIAEYVILARLTAGEEAGPSSSSAGSVPSPTRRRPATWPATTSPWHAPTARAPSSCSSRSSTRRRTALMWWSWWPMSRARH